ncbi:MAG: hypothetical protein KAJ48_08045 [Elusimicrobiales bacterium]|nr:hypothetical protein [Elusimicrobiales bacterium]
MTKQELQGHKKIKICGMKFIIKRINPLLDFESNNIPQIFTSFISRRKTEVLPDEKKILNQMIPIIEAGVVYPELVAIGTGEKENKEDGITVKDLFVNPEMGSKLFQEIMFHSLNRFRGIKGVFFSVKIRLLCYIDYLKNMESYRRKLPLTEK